MNTLKTLKDFEDFLQETTRSTWLQVNETTLLDVCYSLSFLGQVMEALHKNGERIGVHWELVYVYGSDTFPQMQFRIVSVKESEK